MEPEGFKYKFDKDVYDWDNKENIGPVFLDEDGYYKYCDKIENEIMIERIYDETHKPAPYVIDIKYLD